MPKAGPGWDLTALLNAADPRADLPERHLWLVRLLEWLRHAPASAAAASGDAPAGTPPPLLRLRHLLNVLERHPEHHERVAALFHRFWREVDSTALLADFGFAPRMHLWGEFARRLRERLLPGSPATADLGELFRLLFPDGRDADWLRALDAPTLARVAALVGPTLPRGGHWRHAFLEAIMFLASAVRAAGFSAALRPRMSPELLVETPFRQLARVAERVRELAESDAPGATEQLLREAQFLRGLLDACRHCARSVHEHLEAHGVSVDVMFEVDQLIERTHRIDALLTCVLSPDPAQDVAALVADLVATADERRSLRALFAQNYSLLARKVAERSAETGEHYITRDRAEYRAMLRAAAGGGAVIAATTYLKFLVMALGLSAFWGGFWSGANYAVSFVIVQLLHWTVATKQPAMTAPAMARRLAEVREAARAGDDGGEQAAIERFVDEVANLIRSQAAGIFGNLALVAPLVLGVQLACRQLFGMPLVGTPEANHVLHSITLLGPTALFAAFTGVLLFVSSLIAGWAENWFVWHRLDSAIAWNPRIVARLGAARARRWSAWWRANVSGLAANVSLGLMLGLVPAVASFFAVPLEVRHVTLSAGQLAAAAGALGLDVLREPAFWWCVAGIAATGVLNLTVSFFLAFRVALRSRGMKLAERSLIYRAIRRRLRHAPLSFLFPPRDVSAV